MAKKAKYLELDPKEYETVYRMHITAVPEGGMTAIRALNDLLDQLETAGAPLPGQPADAVPLFTAPDGAVLVLSSAEEATFRRTLMEGVKRYQVWASRSVPMILDRLESLDAREIDNGALERDEVTEDIAGE